MEGKFYRVKSPNHPHTNMAKAAVNMMTRTCAEDLAKRGIFMNSVDTVRSIARSQPFIGLNVSLYSLRRAGSTTRTHATWLCASLPATTSR